MYSDRDWTKAITKLTRLTVDGSVDWELADNFSSREDYVLDRAFYSNRDSKTYLVISYKKQVWVDEGEYYWERGFGFEIWNGDRVLPFQQKIAVSPELPAISNLFKTVEAHFAKQQDALGFLLSDDK